MLAFFVKKEMNMSNKCNVVYTSDVNEMKYLLPTIKSFLNSDIPLVLARKGTDKEAINLDIRKDAVRLGIGDSNFSRMAIIDRSIKEMLNTKGFFLNIYVGSEPALMDNHPAQKKSLRIRSASVCSKCECVIEELITEATQESVMRTYDVYRGEKANDVTTVELDNLGLNIVYTNNCRIC